MEIDQVVDLIFYGLAGFVVLVFILIVYNIRKARKNRRKRKQLEDIRTKAFSSSDSKNIADLNMQLIVKYYDQNLLQHRMTFITTLIVASIGFIAIILGLFIFFRYSQNRDIAYMTSAAGIIAELITALFFHQNKNVMKQLNQNHLRLIEGLDLQAAITLVESLPDNDKTKKTKEIIDILLKRSEKGNDYGIEENKGSQK